MEEAAEVCLINIGPKERRKRLGFGVVFFIISAAIAAVMLRGGASWVARLGLFLPLFASGLGYFQYRAKT